MIPCWSVRKTCTPAVANLDKVSGPRLISPAGSLLARRAIRSSLSRQGRHLHPGEPLKLQPTPMQRRDRGSWSGPGRIYGTMMATPALFMIPAGNWYQGIRGDRNDNY